MDDDFTFCRVCGEFVLQISGWTEFINSYSLLRATWRSEESFFQGALHFSCLPGWEHLGAFQREFTEIATGRGRELTVEIQETTHTLSQPGLYYSDPVFHGGTCDIYRNTATDRWLVLTRRGPWYTLDRHQLRGLAERGEARVVGGGERVPLPRDPGPGIEEMPLPELLAFLGSEDKYAGLFENEAPAYEIWSYFPRKRIVEYSVDVDLPLPDEAKTFLAVYAREYELINLDETGEGEGNEGGRGAADGDSVENAGEGTTGHRQGD